MHRARGIIKTKEERIQRMGQKQMQALQEEMHKLLKTGFICFVDIAKWASHVVVTPKKDGRWRVYIDFKPLSEATIRIHIISLSMLIF